MQRLGAIIRGELNMGDTGKVECVQARDMNNENNSEVGNLVTA